MNSEKNIVATTMLMNDLGFDCIFDHAIQTKNRELFFQLMFAADVYGYEWLIRRPEYAETIFKLTGPEQIGILHRIIDNATADSLNDFRSAQEKGAHRVYLEKIGLTKDDFTRIYFSSQYQRPDILTIADAKAMPLRLLTLAENSGRRLGFSLALVNKSDLPPEISIFNTAFCTKPGPAHSLLGFLSVKDQARLSAVSTATFDLCNNSLNAKINKFLAKLDTEIRNKPFYSHRNFDLTRREKVIMSILLLFLIVNISSWVQLGLAETKLDNTINLMRKTPGRVRGTYCDDLLNNAHSSCRNVWPDEKDECKKLCADLPSAYNWYTGSITGSIFSILPLVITLIFPPLRTTAISGARKIKNGFFRGTRRFDNTTINDFSAQLQLDYQHLLTEFSNLSNFNLNVQSTVSQIRHGLQEIVEKNDATQKNILKATK